MTTFLQLAEMLYPDGEERGAVLPGRYYYVLYIGPY
jgi:hypothetical protein